MSKRSIVIAISIIAVAIIGGFIAATIQVAFFGRPSAGSDASSSSTAQAIDTSGWETYTSSAFGFSIKYPPSWQKSPGQLTADNPRVFFGNPLDGTSTYSMQVFVYDDPQNLSASDYVRAMIASDTAMDAGSGAASGTAPRMTPQYSREFAFTTASGLPAYELYDVFEFDHGGEEVYVQDGAHMLFFNFPMNEDNPNIADPAANNATAHAMIGTLVLTGASAH